MVGVDAKSTTKTLNYEVFRVAIRSEVSLVDQASIDVVSYMSRDHFQQTQTLVSDLWLGRRVAFEMDTKTHSVEGTYTVFQPRAYDVAAARTAVSVLAMAWAGVALAIVFELPWPTVALLGMATYASIYVFRCLPNNTSEQVTHDAEVDVPVEVAYYIDPSLPALRELKEGYTKVVWDDGHEFYDPVAAFDAVSAVRADPWAAPDWG